MRLIAAQTPIFAIDRTLLPVRADLVEIISDHLSRGETVRVEDSEWPRAERLRYIVQRAGDATLAFDGHGDRLGIFAALDALVAHAERATA